MSPSPTVHVHVHLVMAGAFPLRVADLLFTDDELVVPEYEYLTPFALARGKVETVSRTARTLYDERGLEGLVDAAERTHRLPYDEVRSVRVFDGGRFARPKIAIDAGAGPPYAYRVHASVDRPALSAALESLGERRGFAVESVSEIGFHPTTSLRRFLADR